MNKSTTSCLFGLSPSGVAPSPGAGLYWSAPTLGSFLTAGTAGVRFAGKGRNVSDRTLDALERLGPEWEKVVRDLHRSGWRR